MFIFLCIVFKKSGSWDVLICFGATIGCADDYIESKLNLSLWGWGDGERAQYNVVQLFNFEIVLFYTSFWLHLRCLPKFRAFLLGPYLCFLCKYKYRNVFYRVENPREERIATLANNKKY